MLYRESPSWPSLLCKKPSAEIMEAPWVLKSSMTVVCDVILFVPVSAKEFKILRSSSVVSRSGFLETSKNFSTLFRLENIIVCFCRERKSLAGCTS